MKHILSKIAIMIGLLSCVYATYSCINDDEELPQPTVKELQVGDRLPDFSVVMNDGTTLHTKDLQGHNALIVFFHTQCPDCQKELPVLQQLYEAQPYPFKMVTISRQESAISIQKYWNEHQLTLPYSAQEDATIYHLFAASLIPRVYVTDKERTIRAIYTDSPIATYEELLTNLKNLSQN